jgi:hypothetical protein
VNHASLLVNGGAEGGLFQETGRAKRSRLRDRR